MQDKIFKPSRSAFISILCIYIVLTGALFLGCQNSGQGGLTRDQYRSAATALFQQQLYRETVEMYENYLKSDVIPTDDIPKVLYQVGTIYQDNLLDAKSALAKYTVVKALYPNETFSNQLGKRIVACLEILGRSIDATQTRSRLTDLVGDSSGIGKGGSGTGAASTKDLVVNGSTTVVAELDGRKITLGEVASLVGKLPEAPLELNQLIREYVAQLLIAESARRKGVADKPEIKLRMNQIENQILAQAGLQDEIKIQPPSGNDLKYYFEANKSRYLVGKDSNATFESMTQRVQTDWAREKQGAEYQKYVERLLQTAKVNFFNPKTGAAATP